MNIFLKSILLCAFLWLGNVVLCHAGVPFDYLVMTEQDAAVILSGKHRRAKVVALDRVKGQ